MDRLRWVGSGLVDVLFVGFDRFSIGLIGLVWAWLDSIWLAWVGFGSV